MAYLAYASDSGEIRYLEVSDSLACSNRPDPASLTAQQIATMVKSLPTPPSGSHYEATGCSITDGPWVEDNDSPPSFIPDQVVRTLRIEPQTGGALAIRTAPAYGQLPHLVIRNSAGSIEAEGNAREFVTAPLGGVAYYALWEVPAGLSSGTKTITFQQDDTTVWAQITLPLGGVSIPTLLTSDPLNPAPGGGTAPQDYSGYQIVGIYQIPT